MFEHKPRRNSREPRVNLDHFWNARVFLIETRRSLNRPWFCQVVKRVILSLTEIVLTLLLFATLSGKSRNLGFSKPGDFRLFYKKYKLW